MPSLRKKVTEFLRQLSANNNVHFDPETSDTKDEKASGCFIQRYLNGEHKGGLGPNTTTDRGKSVVYHGGRDGADLPVLRLKTPLPEVFAAFTGPDGGLTTVNRGGGAAGDGNYRGVERHLSTEDPDVDFIDDGKDEGASLATEPSKEEGDGVMYFSRSYGNCFRLRKSVLSAPVDNSCVKIRAMGTVFLCKGENGKWEKEGGSGENWGEEGRTTHSSPGGNSREKGKGGLGMRKSCSAPSQRGCWSLGSNRGEVGAGETAQKSAKSSVAAGSAVFSDDDLRKEIAGVRGGWQRWNRKAYGIAKSLYERHPVSGRVAGSPVADAFAIVARKDSALLALADGVNWGPKAATAARAALHGSLRHLHVALYNPPTSNIGVKDTKAVFVAILRSFHEAHSLILQEEGMLTTLTVAAVLPLKEGEGKEEKIVDWDCDVDSKRWAVCVVNVGDSLAYVYNKNHGVREITMGSHDIHSMRDMRDALGALGPAEGQNPELNNLTCSLTIAYPGDIVFLTSDGVSDNFDPVVGKFALPKVEPSSSASSKASEGKGESAKRSSRAGGGASSNRGESSIPTSKSTGNVVGETGPGRPRLPVVEAHQRHALTLLRMEDLLVNGVSGEGAPEKGLDAVDLCHRLVEFATRLTAAKRHILEDPELYVDEAEGLTGAPAKAEQRGRRRKVCERLASVPGKLDHASVVAYVVGEFTGEEEVVDASKATLCEEETELEEGEDKNGSEKLMSSSLTKETFLVQNNVLEGEQVPVGMIAKSKKETAEKKEEDDVNGWVDKDGLTNVEDSSNPVATELFETGL